MQPSDFILLTSSLFNTRSNKHYNSQSGFTYISNNGINKIGYCTNLTPDSIKEANKARVDLILTHHDAWDFMFEMREDCHELLKEYNISHYFNHLPLDDCNFGTNSSLIQKLGLTEIKKTHDFDGFYCGRIAKPKTKLSFNALTIHLEELLAEPVKAWDFGVQEVDKISLVCGGGGQITDVKEAVEQKCDVYITSEYSLYTLQYAKHMKINLLIGSHTGMEKFGVESLAKKLKKQNNKLDFFELKEEFVEI